MRFSFQILIPGVYILPANLLTALWQSLKLPIFSELNLTCRRLRPLHFLRSAEIMQELPRKENQMIAALEVDILNRMEINLN